MCLRKVTYKTDQPPKSVFWAYKVFDCGTDTDTVAFPFYGNRATVEPDKWLKADLVAIKSEDLIDDKSDPYTSGFHCYTRLTDAIRFASFSEVVVRVKVRGRRTKGYQDRYWSCEKSCWVYRYPTIVCDEMFVPKEQVELALKNRREDRVWGKRS